MTPTSREPTVSDCPECAQGKHLNCTLSVLVATSETMEVWLPCPCHERDHERDHA